MLVKLFLAIVVIAVVWSLMAHYRKQPPQIKKKLAFQYIIYGAAIIFFLLAATGHLHWISAAITAIVAGIVRFLPVVARFAPLIFHMSKQAQSGKTSKGNTSTVQSTYLKLVLDHDSESMSGEIISGPHQSKSLEALSRVQLKELLQHYYENDNESWQLLNAYVQRKYPDDKWEFTQGSHQASDKPSAMTRKEALEILGLNESATDKDIKTAHKQLMQRLHPDRGGSSYLAARVNEAKDFLLKKKS